MTTWLLIALLLIPSPALAALAYVQSATCTIVGGGASSCDTGSITSTTGNLLVANWSTYTDIFSAITDNKSNTFTDAIAKLTTGNTNAGMQQKANASGGALHVFTMTLTGNGYTYLSVSEVSGAETSSPLDQTSTDITSSVSSHTSGSTSATTQADEILIGFGTGESGLTGPWTTDTGAGWTEITNDPTTGLIQGIITGYRIVSATGSYAYTCTSTTNSNTFANGIATFKASSFVGGYILSEVGDCINAENSNRLITEDISAGVGPCGSNVPERAKMGVGT
jgi:energy-coupling factor transporter transmembrane protein EcfT